MTEDNQEVRRQKASKLEKYTGCAAFIIFFFLVIAFIGLVIMKHNRGGISASDQAAVAAAMNFFNQSMAYFTETGATTATPDSLPKFEPDPKVTITGGPMTFDGTNVKFVTPMKFRYKASSISILLRPDGSREVIKE